MKMEEAFYDICLYLYGKNILDYIQIAQNGTEFTIPDIESHCNVVNCLAPFPLNYPHGLWMTPCWVIVWYGVRSADDDRL